MRALLIQKDVKRKDCIFQTTKGLRALLIQKDVKLKKFYKILFEV